MRDLITIVDSVPQGNLYHGTSLLRLLFIIASDSLRGSNAGDYGVNGVNISGVSLTTSRDIAWSFARDASETSNDDLREMMGSSKHAHKKVQGAMLMFDSAEIHAKLPVIPDGYDAEQQGELEVRVRGDIKNVEKLLSGIYFSESDLYTISGDIEIAIEAGEKHLEPAFRATEKATRLLRNMKF